MKTLKLILCSLLLGLVVVGGAGCKKKYDVRDVDPGAAGRVRSLSPESQDAIMVADEMLRSLMANQVIAARTTPPIIHMLPMENNTRFAFNQEVFTTLLKGQLNENANGKLLFRSGDTWDDMKREREMKREGEVDYDPTMRANAPVGADYFLKGRVDGLSNASKKGQSEYMVYSFKLVDAETGIEVWERVVDTKKEGKDDLLYR
jgi:PBP1b-binding outer membrane lipoprotein LpoB